jgi:chromosome segregation ATPase
MGWDVTQIDDSQIAQTRGFVPSNGDDHTNVASSPKRQWLTFGGNRKLKENQNRQVTELVQSLQGHVQRQTEVAESANQNLERLIASLAELPAVMQAQQLALGKIQNQLDAPAGQKHVQEVLAQLGGIRDAVRESSSTFARYSEVAQKSSDTIAAELQKQGQAVTQLAQTSDPMMRAINALRSDVGARGQELAQCVTTLNTKLIQFASAALILALIAAIIGVVAIFR